MTDGRTQNFRHRCKLQHIRLPSFRLLPAARAARTHSSSPPLLPSALLRPTYDVWPDLCWESEEGRRRRRTGGGDDCRAVAVQQLLSYPPSPPPSPLSSSCPSGWIALASASVCVRASCLLLPSQLLLLLSHFTESLSLSLSRLPSSLPAVGRSRSEEGREGGRAAGSRLLGRSLCDGCPFSPLFFSFRPSFPRSLEARALFSTRPPSCIRPLNRSHLMACIKHVPPARVRASREVPPLKCSHRKRRVLSTHPLTDLG